MHQAFSCTCPISSNCLDFKMWMLNFKADNYSIYSFTKGLHICYLIWFAKTLFISITNAILILQVDKLRLRDPGSVSWWTARPSLGCFQFLCIHVHMACLGDTEAQLHTLWVICSLWNGTNDTDVWRAIIVRMTWNDAHNKRSKIRTQSMSLLSLNDWVTNSLQRPHF